MTDDHLRALERRFQETSAVEDEARVLQERLRVGLVRAEGLEVAAYCRYPAAEAALGRAVEPEGVIWFKVWLPGFGAFGRVALVRAVVALARQVHPTWVAGAHARADDDFARALEVARAWCLEPTAERESVAREAGDRAFATHALLPDDVGAPARAAAVVAAYAAEAAGGAGATRPRWPRGDVGEAAECALEVKPFPELLAGVRAELVAWALGRGDLLAPA